jgi:glycosyltransferase involved in cell wall biosynthesis
MSAALYFTPDGYSVDGRQIMGRRMAGAAFLRAVVEGREGERVIGYGFQRDHEALFGEAVRAIDPTAETGWIRRGRFDLLARSGALFYPGPSLGAEARLRLRTGPARYSLCGVTHTISTNAALSSIAGLMTEPVMPWDALICTSQAALSVVRDTLDSTIDQLRWRLGAALPEPRLPQLPVIPLGVHCSDWTPSEERRRAARERLTIGEDEIAILFAGRLSVAGKAHPFQMFEALRLVAGRCGRPITLVQAGQYYNDAIGRAFRDAAEAHGAGVRSLHVDGANAERYADAYAGADLFLSLADSNQETFGLTPVEAMAAGLPAIVSDWNGYRDTVRDGIDGIRVPTWAPSPGSGGLIGLAYEIDGEFELYSSRMSSTVSVDMAALVERISALAGDAALRRRMGAAARARALADYDWAVVYRRYRALWAELAAMRAHARADPATAGWLEQAPRAHSVHRDPFSTFASYPTRAIGAATMVQATLQANRAAYEALAAEPIFQLWRIPAEIAETLIAAAREPIAIENLANVIGQQVSVTIELLARLAKMNLLILG